MENSIINFDFEGRGVRVFDINGEPWWVGKDVCESFNDTNPNRSVGRISEEDKQVVPIIDSMGRNQNITIVNESGLYSLLFAMQPQKANKWGTDAYPIETVERIAKLKRFKRWITHDVIPSIRKNGGYIAGQENLELTTEEFLAKAMTMAHNVLAEREKRIAALEEDKKKLALLNEAQAETIAVMKPKADYYDQILKSKNTMLATQIAKDYGMSAVAFNKLLNQMKIQYRAGTQWVLYQTYADHGYTRSETHTGDDGMHHWSSVQTKWTQEGRLFLYNTLKAKGILPVCERSK